MIDRPRLLALIHAALGRSPIVVLSGPRQCGKTTLARQLLTPESLNYFDLEDPISLARLDEPITALGSLKGLVVIDEIQRRPELFPVLRVLVDREVSARFLLLGGAFWVMERRTSESLAGRIERIAISGFTLDEVGAGSRDRLWERGGFPRAFLADTDEDSAVWRSQFIQALLERDMSQWGVSVPALALRRLWTIIAHYHGQTWNASEAARTLDVSQPTARRYLDLLTDANVVRQLQPYHANVKKRQVKSPKVYVRDSGLLHRLLGIRTYKELLEHPKVGASWEGFIVEQIMVREPHEDAWFWATHQGAEMDLLLQRETGLFGVEIKRSDAPRITPSIRIALEDVGLQHVAVVYPGSRRYRLASHVEAVPAGDLAGGPGCLFG